MADAYTVLAQSKPSATTLTDVLTVAASTSVVVSSIIICNQSATATSYRISVAIAGAADTAAQYIAYDRAILGNATHEITCGITLATTDKVRVYNTLATLSFNLFGVKVT
jgi:hypothetical protein